MPQLLNMAIDNTYSSGDYISWLWYLIILVGDFNPSEKYEFVSWDDDNPKMMRKILKKSCSKPPTIYSWFTSSNMAVFPSDGQGVFPQLAEAPVGILNEENGKLVLKGARRANAGDLRRICPRNRWDPWFRMGMGRTINPHTSRTPYCSQSIL